MRLTKSRAEMLKQFAAENRTIQDYAAACTLPDSNIIYFSHDYNDAFEPDIPEFVNAHKAEDSRHTIRRMDVAAFKRSISSAVCSALGCLACLWATMTAESAPVMILLYVSALLTCLSAYISYVSASRIYNVNKTLNRKITWTKQRSN